MSSEKFTAADVIDVINLRRGFNAVLDAKGATYFNWNPNAVKKCDCIDCGGTAPGHTPRV